MASLTMTIHIGFNLFNDDSLYKNSLFNDDNLYRNSLFNDDHLYSL